MTLLFTLVLLVSLMMGLIPATKPIVAAELPVNFSRQILPLLSDRCFHCHGPDESQRAAELRLDLREEAVANRDGTTAIVPGNPQASALLTRIASSDPDVQMPPPDSHRPLLTPQEVRLFRRWIEEGAVWGRHWAFEKPVRTVPGDSRMHPVDWFVQQQLHERGLKLAEPASRSVLMRRLSFDLTGLPPTHREADAFMEDSSPDACEKLIDRLLDSPHYGERMAMWWLDAARYSDTDGFQQDAVRTNWPWRDWVVSAFNSNMPFDQFTIEQFAGDLLPQATSSQILATCFHRNHMTNGEGGRDPEESRIDYVMDRVNTTGTVWLGLTLGCAQCHTHKFDPISQTDYYSLFAFFDSIEEDGKAGKAAQPYLKVTSPAARRAVVEAEAVVRSREPRVESVRQQAEQEFETWLTRQITQVKDGFQPWFPLVARALQAVEGTTLKQSSDGIIQASGRNPRQDDYRLIAPTQASRVTGLKLEVFPHKSHTGGKLSRGARGEFILTDVKLQVRRQGHSQLRDIEIANAIADVEDSGKGRKYGAVSGTLDDDPRNGWTTLSHNPKVPHVAVFILTEPLSLQADEELVFVMFQRSTEGDANIGRFRVSVTDQSKPAIQTLGPLPLEELAAAVQHALPADVSQKGDDTPEPDRHSGEEPVFVGEKLRSRLLDQFLADHTLYQAAREDLDRAKRQLEEVKKGAGPLDVMVLAEREEPRTTYLLERGVWDKKGQQVHCALPEAILPATPEQSRSRLDLAHWLVSRDNPLTARVIVNQLWQLCFGAGLVRTPEDFGLQGELPTHPELLDWLAVELMEHDWDLKHVLRLIVTSRTYQQSSIITPELLERDPENRLLARGARFRLPSWMIRDAALQVSGLLNPAIGGPPVMPYQPDGVWEEMFMGRLHYEPSQGPPQFRRTLYAFWRRSAAPTFLFDNAQRRVCEVRTTRTNTPLQALTLLNDLNLREAARELAKSVAAQSSGPPEKIQSLFQTILSRSPTVPEMDILQQEFERARSYYRDTPDAAKRLLDFGQPEKRITHQPAEVAALLVTASMIFNLDEAITHE